MESNEPPQATLTTPTDPSRLSKVLGELGDRLCSEHHTRRVEAHEERDREIDRQNQEQEIEFRRKRLWKERGVRYQKCTLANFEVVTTAHRLVRDALYAYHNALADNVRQGVNLVLIGPEGTGKDHLLASLFNPAISAGLSIKWTSGAVLWSRLRDGINESEAEWTIMRQYITPDILVLSDPQPLFDRLSNYQAATLYRIVDERVNNCRVIWAAMNCADRAEADSKLSAPIVGRLTDGAVSLACDWKSYRQPLDSRRMPAGAEYASD